MPTTYVFAGNPFNQFVGTACPPVCHITGSMTLAQPLAPNLAQDVSGPGSFTAVSFTFTDGRTAFTQANATSSGFSVHTDANGNITQWGLYMAGPGGGAGLFLYYGGPGSVAQNGVNVTGYQAYFMSDTSAGGAWSLAGSNSGDIREATRSYLDSSTPLAISWNPVFPDTNYTSTCSAETTPSDFLLPTITSRCTNGITVSPTDGGSPAGILDCIAIPDFDSSALRHGRMSFSGSPVSVTVPWSTAFADTDYTAVCTAETEGPFSAGFTGVMIDVSPASVTVLNAGYAAGTIHCIGVPDSASTPVRHARVPVAGFPTTVTVSWNVPFPDAFYAANCEEQGVSADSDAALAIQAGSKLPGSMKVLSEIPSGTLHCIAIHLSGDVNGDGVLDCSDLAVVAASFGKRQGQAGFDPRADVNGDGVVNIVDLSIVAKQVPAGTACH